MSSFFERSTSVSSMRRMNVPPWRRAKSHVQAVRAPPTWSEPVGEGANRTRGAVMGRAGYQPAVGHDPRVTSGPLSVPRREALAADLVLVVVTAIWGSTFIVNRIVVASAPPLLFVLVRFALGAAILWLVARGRPTTPHLVRDSAAVGLLLAAGIGFQVVGQLFTTASKAAFVTGLSVPLTPIAGYLMTRKKPSRENLAGLVIAAAGFVVLTWPRTRRPASTREISSFS